MDPKTDDDKHEASGGDGYVTEESEGDFVDVKEMKNWADKDKVMTSPKPEHAVKGNLEVKRSQTVRSSMKSPLSRDNDKNGVKTKRTISFNIRPTIKPQVEIEPAQDERLRNLFASSRWSTTSSSSSSEPETPQKPQTEQTPDDVSTTVVMSSSPEGHVLKVEIIEETAAEVADTRNVRFHPEIADQVRWKSKSLGRNEAKKISSQEDVKRRHSINDVTQTKNQPVILRDSAIDLISDDDHSDAYTAVSLAGTLKRNAPIPGNNGRRRKYVIIAAASSSLIAITVIIVLSVLLARK